MMLRLISMLLFSGCLSSAIAQNKLENTRTSTVDDLRKFRGQVFAADLGNQGDSLASLLSNLLEMAKVSKSIDDLDAVSNYTSTCRDVFNSSSGSEKTAVVKMINSDLLLKAGEDALFSVEGNKAFGTKVKVKIRAEIDGQPVSGSYRIYWAYFLGRSLSKLIESGLYEGSSDRYDNPYDLQIRIPGYICFWLKDERTNSYYRAAFDYKILDRDSKLITVNFQPLN